MNKKLVMLSSVVLSASTLLAACSGGGSNTEGKVLNLSTTADIPSMNPSLATDMVSFQTFENVYEGLYRLDKNTKPVPALAVGEPEKSKDKKTWTIKLRKDAKWSNGDPVTANDFVYAWREVVNPKTGSEYAFIMFDIENAQDINEGKKDVNSLGVKAIDNHTLQIKLKNVQPYFEGLLSFGTFMPKNEKVAKKYGDKYGTDANKAVYNGPFKMTEWKTEDSFKLVKNDKYWNKKVVKLDGINYRVVKDVQTGLNLYDTDKIDSVGITSDNVEKYKDKPDFKTELTAAMSYFKVNHKNKYLANKNVRLAIAKSIDKQSYVDKNLKNGSVPATQITPKDVYKGPDDTDFSKIAGGDILKYDTKAAKEYWKKAKQELGEDKITIELLTTDQETAKTDAEFFKEQLEKNLDGLTVKIKMQPFKQKLALEDKRDYDLSYSNWFPDYADPMTFLDLFWSKQTNTNYKDAKYDQLIEDAKGPLLKDPKARWKALGEASTMLLEDAHTIPVIQRGSAYLQKTYVKYVLTNSSNIYQYDKAYIKK